MKKSTVALSICALFSFVGCIDRDFDIAETSGEMTIGGEELIVPLSEISPIYLSDLLDDNEALKPNGNGVYQITFSSFGDDPTKFESIPIEGIKIPVIENLSPKLDPVSFDMVQLPNEFSLTDIHKSFSVDFPTLGEAVKVKPIQIHQSVDFNLPPAVLEYSGKILPETIAAHCPPLTSSSRGVSSFNAQITILEQLQKIDYVEFGNENTPGAPFYIKMDLNGLKGINGGGTISLNLNFPEGYKLLLPKQYEGSETIKLAAQNILSLQNYHIEKGQEVVELLLYLHQIDYSQHSFVDGKLDINDTISFDYDLRLSVCGGEIYLDNLPEFTISATPIYKDIEVIINHFELAPAKYDVNYTFENIPKEIDINKISFTNNSSVSLRLMGLEWLQIKDNITQEEFSPYLVVRFPSCMHFSRAELANPASISNLRSSDLHLGGNGDIEDEVDRDYILTASAEALASGIKLYLDHIDGNNSLVKRVEDALVIDTTIEAEIHMNHLDGHTILASSIVPPTSPLNIVFDMSDMNFTIDKERSEVKINEMVLDLDISNQLPSLSQDIEIPEMISSVESISIGKAGGNGAPVAINFSLGTLNGSHFPVEEVDLDVAINIGNLLRPTDATKESGIITINDKGESVLTIKQAWKPNVAPLTAHLEFDALENIPAIENGHLKLDQAIKIERCCAKIKDGQNIDLTAINNAGIDMQILIDNIEVREFRGGINLSVAPEEMIVELGDLSSLGIDIKELSLNPVLTLNLADNPTGIPFFANVALKTFNAEGSQLAEIVVPEIQIAGSGPSTIVISTPYNEGNYRNVQFVGVKDLAQLLSYGIPAKIAVNMSVATDKEGIYTIDLTRASQGYELNYQYEVVVPLEFNGDVNLSYESKVTGLNETFAGLANDVQGLKVGDIGLIAELGTTIPFDIELTAKLINADGTDKGVEAKLNIGNDGIIEGWTDKDGKNPHITKLDIDFNLGNSHSLKALESVDGIEFSFKLSNPNTEKDVALKDTQYLNGNIKLRVRNGLTIDIFDFLKGEGE